MPKLSIEDLVETALSHMLPEPSEDVTHELFEFIENDPVLLHDYDALCEHHESSRLPGRAIVNRSIGSWVKKKTGRSTLSGGHPSTRSGLIKTFSKLG